MAPSITVLTVTYGDRWHLLENTLESVMAPRVKIVIVANGVSPRSRAALAEFCHSHKSQVSLIALDVNRGSAPAFEAGLKAAYSMGGGVLILDDDNPVSSDALDEVERLSLRIEERSDTPTAVAIHRPRNQAQRRLVSGESFSTVFRELRPGAFHGFDLFRMFGSMFEWRHAERAQDVSAWGASLGVQPLPVAMWGGLFLPPSVAAQRLLPDPALVLYCDDNDFSAKLWGAGCNVVLADELLIHDALEWRSSVGESRRWRDRFPSTFRVPDDGLWRLEYLHRNQAYMSLRQTETAAAKFRLVVNATVRLAAVAGMGLIAGRPRLAFRLTAASMRGLLSRLGPAYPLPQAGGAG